MHPLSTSCGAAVPCVHLDLHVHIPLIRVHVLEGCGCRARLANHLLGKPATATKVFIKPTYTLLFDNISASHSSSRSPPPSRLWLPPRMAYPAATCSPIGPSTRPS
ncbi:hypothetical protein B0H12DRAFT_1151779 [Mycena haematopus]|nr:hypothetical protein B0H12DRAFT_1151779 [Mycena haematopus]